VPKSTLRPPSVSPLPRRRATHAHGSLIQKWWIVERVVWRGGQASSLCKSMKKSVKSCDSWQRHSCFFCVQFSRAFTQVLVAALIRVVAASSPGQLAGARPQQILGSNQSGGIPGLEHPSALVS
jgi:hypothetical protein